MESLDEIYREYADMVYRFIFAKVQNEHIAEEVTQETFYQAVRCSDKFDGSCKVSTWLCAIAKNQLASYLRKNRQEASLEDWDSTVDSPEDQWIAQENRIALMKALHSLPEPYKEVVYLRLFGELSFKEIGEIMEKTENWARVTFTEEKKNY